MKKLFIVLAVLLALVGCTPANGGKEENTQPVNSDTVKVKIYKDQFIKLLPEDKQQELYNSGLSLENGEVSALGADLSGYTFKSVDGQDVKLPKGPYILEIVGSWCGYCQALTTEVIEGKYYETIPVYQYFMYGTAEDVASFYEAIGLERPADIVALTENEQFELFLQEHEFYSVPLTLVVNEEGKVSFSHLGYLKLDEYKSFVDYGLAARLYDTTVEGMSLTDYLSTQQKVRNYINNLEEIEVPKSVLE